jgi:hypothetical protein
MNVPAAWLAYFLLDWNTDLNTDLNPVYSPWSDAVPDPVQPGPDLQNWPFLLLKNVFFHLPCPLPSFCLCSFSACIFSHLSGLFIHFPLALFQSTPLSPSAPSFVVFPVPSFFCV